MQKPQTAAADKTATEPSTNPATGPGTDGRKETPPTPPAPDAEAAEPSAMIEEGERPAPDHGSVEGLSSADRPGGMIGEG